jgi:hypothetical protein
MTIRRILIAGVILFGIAMSVSFAAAGLQWRWLQISAFGVGVIGIALASLAVIAELVRLIRVLTSGKQYL